MFWGGAYVTKRVPIIKSAPRKPPKLQLVCRRRRRRSRGRRIGRRRRRGRRRKGGEGGGGACGAGSLLRPLSLSLPLESAGRIYLWGAIHYCHAYSTLSRTAPGPPSPLGKTGGGRRCRRRQVRLARPKATRRVQVDVQSVTLSLRLQTAKCRTYFH